MYLFIFEIISEFQPAGGDVAQLEERCLRKAEVGGSIPLISTIFICNFKHEE